MEFPRVRITRSNRIRTTRKQKGGAPSYAAAVPLPKYFTGNYISKWTTKLAKPELIKLLTDPEFSKVASPGKYSDAYYTAWLDAVKYQDQIYRAGLEIIIEDLTGKTNTEEQYTDILDKIKTTKLPETSDLVSIITHLEHTLSLAHGTDFTLGASTNKFEDMFRERMDPQASSLDTEMANLLLNPKRIENILVQSIAHIIVMLKDGTNLQDIIASSSNPILKAALIKKWMFFTVHGTELQTNEEIRDAFITGSGHCGVPDILEFWTAFVEELTKPAGPLDFPFNDDYATYGILAAKLAKAPNLIDEISKAAVADIQIDYASIPDGFGDSPVGSIFKRLVPNLVFFLKHLEGAIEEVNHT